MRGWWGDRQAPDGFEPTLQLRAWLAAKAIQERGEVVSYESIKRECGLEYRAARAAYQCMLRSNCWPYEDLSAPDPLRVQAEHMDAKAPTPEEIAERAAEERKTWPKSRLRRSIKPWSVPHVSMTSKR